MRVGPLLDSSYLSPIYPTDASKADSYSTERAFKLLLTLLCYHLRGREARAG